MESTIVSHILYIQFPLIYYILLYKYQHSVEYWYEYSSTCPWVRIQVWVLLIWNSRVRTKYERRKFSPRVFCVKANNEREFPNPGQDAFYITTNKNTFLEKNKLKKYSERVGRLGLTMYTPVHSIFDVMMHYGFCSLKSASSVDWISYG